MKKKIVYEKQGKGIAPTFTVRLSEGTLRRLKQRAKKRDKTLSQAVRGMIYQALADQKSLKA